ncbi:chloride channel [Pyronema omphalodes]|nr:chloride channel [Pyronema omphalodes]
MSPPTTGGSDDHTTVTIENVQDENDTIPQLPDDFPAFRELEEDTTTFKRRTSKATSGYSSLFGAAPSALGFAIGPSFAPLSSPPEPDLRPSQSSTSLHTLQPPDEYLPGYSPPVDNNDQDEPSHFLPGSRIYDNLTAIDWSFEYSKERNRQRALAARKGVFGYLARYYDQSQIWLVLVGTGISAGLVAAGIDVAANWLGDLKEGYCTTAWWLNRGFCCWGLDDKDICEDWKWWGEVMTKGKGGKYVGEYGLYILFSILFATCASVLVKNYAEFAKHSGIPEIKTVLGGFVMKDFLNTWTLVIKSIGLSLAESSGLWLGKEGPLVHVACCCANIMMKPFSALNKNEARKREVLSAASAAGISVAFGSPIGGVLFSLEQLSYYFPDKTMWQSFVCAMVAAVTLQFMNPFRTGKLVLYQVKYTRGWHGFEMVPFALLGVLGGLYGAFFIRMNMKVAAWRKYSAVRHFPVTEVVVVATLTAIVNFPVVFMRPQSSELVANLFQECSPTSDDFFGLCRSGGNLHSILLLLLSSLFGILLSSITFGLLIPAGVILPSMAIGALYGRAIGLILQAWQHSAPHLMIFRSCPPDIECVTPGTFAIIGAASALGGVTRMTVSIVVITFELTGALTYVLPIMVAVMISKWTGDAFGKRGIYESWIAFREYPFLDNRDEPVPDIKVEEMMTRVEDLVVITETGHTVDSLEEIMKKEEEYRGFPVVVDIRNAVLTGYISRTELRYALDQAKLIRDLPGNTECVFSANGPSPTALAVNPRTVDMRPWMDFTPITLRSSSTLLLAANLFQKLGLRYILFVDHGVLQGLLTKKDVFLALNAEGEGMEGLAHRMGRRDGEAEGRGLLQAEGEGDSEVNSLDEDAGDDDEENGEGGGLLGR